MELSRRRAFEYFWKLLAASPLAVTPKLRAQDPDSQEASLYLPDRIPPLDEVVNSFELEEVARKKLPLPVYDHIAGGAGSERTLRRNREFFDRMTFRPRVLVDVSNLDLSTELLGRPMFSPILVGPTSNHGRVHPEGEFATVAGAAAAKTAVILSHRTSRPVGEVAARAGEPLWFQVDAHIDLKVTRDHLKRATDSGCQVVCLTVGSPYRAVLDRDIRNHYLAGGGRGGAPQSPQGPSNGPAWPPSPSRLAAQSSPKMSWDVLDQVKSWAGAPVLLKGIMSAQEAREAIDRGANGVVVSNHGGRAADGVPSTIEVLPGIADAVAGRAPLLVDGGFRRGTDILKALALGADGVLLGRPVLWALAAYGAEGVRKLLEILQHELALAMGLSGQPNLAAVSRGLVKIHKW